MHKHRCSIWLLMKSYARPGWYKAGKIWFWARTAALKVELELISECFKMTASLHLDKYPSSVVYIIAPSQSLHCPSDNHAFKKQQSKAYDQKKSVNVSWGLSLFNQNGTTTQSYWKWSTFPSEDAMNNSLLPGNRRRKKKLPSRVLSQIVFSLFIRKKKVYKVLSAFCILCHWSSDNWLCLGGSLQDMLRRHSGKRYSSKLSLPSQGTVRQRFPDLRGYCKIETTL